MSTKSSIVYGKDFHIYTDLEDEDNIVHIEIRGDLASNYSMSKNSYKISLPKGFLEFLKTIEIFKPKYAHLTDDDIYKMVKKDVDDRIEEYNNSEVKYTLIYSLSILGPIELPIEKQIDNGVNYIKQEREKELLILAEKQKYIDAFQQETLKNRSK